MNLILNPSFDGIDCHEKRDKVVLMIYLGYSTPHNVIKKSLLRYIEPNQNYKFLMFESLTPGMELTYSTTYLLIKKELWASDQIKIIFYSHLYFVEDCFRFIDMMHEMKLIQLPYSPENLGLVIIEPPEIYFGFYWSECIFMTYPILNCEKFGCPALDILTTIDSNNSFTNIVNITMETSGRIRPSSEETLKRFINKLQFTNLTSSDVEIYNVETLRRVKEYHHQFQKSLQQRLQMSKPIVKSVLSINKDISEFIELAKPVIFYGRHKRQIQTNLTNDFSIHKMVFKILRNFSPNKFTERIVSGILRVLNDIDTKTKLKNQQELCQYAYCNHNMTLDSETCLNATELFPDAWVYYRKKNNVLEKFAKLLNHVFSKTVGADDKIYHGTLIKFHSQARKLARKLCQRYFQRLITNFTFTWQPIMGNIEAPLDKWFIELRKWVDRAPISENEMINWDNVSQWIETGGIRISNINVDEIRTLFKFSQSETMPYYRIERKYHIKSKFQTMIRKLLYNFCQNVTGVATQKLAATKVKRVDVAVAALDQSFMAGIRKLHQNMDQEQWMLLRPHIFYHLTQIQQARQNFDHFLNVMQCLFDVHYIEKPNGALAELHDVNAEFDVYQTKLGPYINGSINTSQEWGKEFRESTEYILRSSGAQPTSFINGAAMWIKERETLPSYNFGGTLVLLNLFVRMWCQGRWNWR
jgi:hypothetical protein